MEKVQLFISVLGGLAIFVYGMGLMSEGLTQVAGVRLKAVLGYITRNRVMAIAAGAGITAIIQSSSATTVMTVGFVNAGLLDLTQAIGVIFGANIGTTITGQIVSLKLDDLALPAVTIGVAGLMLAHRSVMRGTWKTVLGFGLLFLGMTMMSSELKAVAKDPAFISFFSKFDCTPDPSGRLPMLSVLGGIAVGTVCTMIVQSSSATIGITIALAEAGLINIWTAVPIVLGDNIGTTITAAFAAIGTNTNARRTALAHALFNILGTCILVCTFPLVLAGKSGAGAPAFFHLVNICADGNAFAGEAPGRHVAMAHTLFNVANVCLLSFFIPQLARLCQRIIRDGRAQRTVTLEPHLLTVPSLALEAATRAVADMTRRSWTIASASLNTLVGRASADDASIERGEKEIDEMQIKIRDYIVSVSRCKLTNREAAAIPELLHCVNDAERISDLALKVYRKTSRVQSSKISAEAIEGISQVSVKVRQLAYDTIDALKNPSSDIKAITVAEKEIHEFAKATARTLTLHMKDQGDGSTNDIAVLSVLSALRDIARHLGNIAVRIPTI
ncbi:MAG: Na/Pi cotransporter family protein [Kiritimatiellae bacterium]|nr:Na/Pi cotransporter family protein [Kiritimatiellia bacterium]